MLTALLSLSAFAADPAPAAPPATPASTAAPAPVDCTTLAGDAKTQCENALALKALQDALAKLGDCAKITVAEQKTQCETQTADLKAKIVALTPPPAKDGKATRSTSNRLEVVNGDE